jgi:hypothetical protein
MVEIDKNEEQKIIAKCQKFLTKSSARYSAQIQKQINDLEAFNGNFWTDEIKKLYRRTNKRKFCLHFSDWSVLGNAIVSPYSSSPWHNELLDRKSYSEIQDSINQIEADNDLKHEFKKAFLRGVVSGAGYVVVTTIADEITGEPKLTAEFVTRQGSVALDPMAEKTDASDAEQGAIVNYISIDKAKRLYGEDVVPYRYPQNQPRLSFTGIDQWPNLEDCVQIVSYYVKNEDGFVDMYKICGNYVVESYELPIKYIPIIRFAGYEKYCSDGIKYSGIVDKTWSLQLGLNIAYSTLMERANRSIKANIIMSTAAGANLDPYYEKKEDEDGSVIMYNQGADIPQVLKEAFETGDLTNIIQTSRELIADVIGIPLAGILGSEDKTATEILIQNNNKQSNVAIFYENAYKACRTFGRIVIEMLTGGYDLNFDLTNGPDVITNNMKHRQELQAVASLLPQEMQPLVAVHMCDTVDSDFVDSVKADIIANLGDQLKIVSEQPTDPIAIHELEKMKNMLDQSMQQLEAIHQENSQLKLQNQSMSLQLQSREIENQIHIYDSQNKWEIERAKLGIEEEKAAVDSNVKLTEAQADLADKALDASQKRLDILEDSMAVTTQEV